MSAVSSIYSGLERCEPSLLTHFRAAAQTISFWIRTVGYDRALPLVLQCAMQHQNEKAAIVFRTAFGR